MLFRSIIVTIPNPQNYLSEIEFRKNQILFFADYTNQEYFSFLNKKVKQVISGENWLINQALSTFEYFTERDDLCKNIDFSGLTKKFNKNVNIFITGFSGSGKTSIGKELAKKLGKNFIDTDNTIEQMARKSISKIFKDEGENAFRNYETKLLNNIINQKNAIISLGGGTILQKEHKKIIEKMQGTIVYIYADLKTSLSRINLASKPLLKAKTFQEMELLFNERKAKYFENSDIIISNIQKTIPPAIAKLYHEFS